MSSEGFKCIFCKQTFDDKESLQVHFRKHGDLNFHQNKKRPQDDQLRESDKPASSKDQPEMVQCDVCPEMFTSISKAITHKHKVHPDHDAKYFCPWCGKLFTMKHLYNKHIQTSHPKEEMAENTFHCDVCKVFFNNAVAIAYHNKFFHRVDEMPSIGNSKKLKMVGQEAVQIFYCPFCGEEYENKVNIQKHLTDEHSDENQHPDDVFRCPICDAIFYHLDAYELHLTYHSIDDLYSERNEIVDAITDFSLDSVPPIAEKVETFDPHATAMGIEQLFEATMGLGDARTKKKKHKKHKKLKKSAITLDQFLNMNTDVFGEGLDFQGIEEVPTQVIAKRLKKPSRKPVQSRLPPNIEKLQRQGIVIKKKPGPHVKPVVVKGNNVFNKNPEIVPQSKPNIAETNNVITKLMNQNNSQIKIMKMSNSEVKTPNEDNVSTKPNSPVADDMLSVENKEPNETSQNSLSVSEEKDKSKENNLPYDPGNVDNIYPDNTCRKSHNPENFTPQDEGSNDSHHKNADILNTEELTKGDDKLSALRNNGNIKSNKQNFSDAKEQKGPGVLDENITDYEEDIDNLDHNGESKKNYSLNPIKHLSHLIVKSCSQDQNQESDINNTKTQQPSDKKVPQPDVSKIAHLIRNNSAKYIESDDNHFTDDENIEPEKVPQPDVSKIAHLIRNNPAKPATNLAKSNITHQTNTPSIKSKYFESDDNENIEPEKVPHPDVSKIAHLIRNNPAKSAPNLAITNIKAQQSKTPSIKAKDIEPKENNFTDDENYEPDKVPDVSKMSRLIRNNLPKSASNPTKTNIIAQQSNTPAMKTKYAEPEENHFTDDEFDEPERVPQPDVSKIAHLIRNNPAKSPTNLVKPNIVAQQSNTPAIKTKYTESEDTHFTDDEFDESVKVQQPDVSKIAHLIRNNPVKSATNLSKNRNFQQSNTPPLKTKDIKSEENSFTDDELNEPVDIVKKPANKLARILNNPHLNIQTIKKSPNVEPHQEPLAEISTKNEKSNADLLKHLKNVTAKPVAFNRSVNVCQSSKVSPKLDNTITKEPGTTAIKKSKAIQEDIEIFNIDDSDSDEGTSSNTQVIKDMKLESTPPHKSVDAIRNINQNITVKSNSQNIKIDKLQDHQFDSENDDEEIDRSHNSKNLGPQISQKQSMLNNVLKNLSKNITVKSGNSSPAYFPNQDRSRDSFPQGDGSESDTDSRPGRVKITEMENAEEEGEHSDMSDHTPQDNVQVQYPESNSDDDGGNHPEHSDHNFSEDDIELHLAANTVRKTNNHTIPNPKLDSLKNVCKNLTIRPAGPSMNRSPQAPFNLDEIPPFAKSLSNQMAFKNLQQGDNSNKQIKIHSKASRNMEQTVGRSMNKSSINQKMVNKEVKTVKTKIKTQTETVVQEITTTVTKTIKTINQSSKQEAEKKEQSNIPQKFPQVIGNHSNFQSVKIRQSAPMPGPRIRNPGIRPTRLALPAPCRPNQLVPVRPRFNSPRQNNPRMPIRPSTSGPIRPQIKMAPGAANTAKRVNTEPPAGHFSCFKKPKESLFPEADFSAMNKNEGDSPAQFSAMHMSKSNYACTTKTVKGNSVVTSTQMKSEMSASSQQLGKLRNLSGLSVMKTSQANQSHIEERTEVSAAKQNTLDAIQRLQSQGLLVKKPRLASEEDEQFNPGPSANQHFSDEEFGS